MLVYLRLLTRALRRGLSCSGKQESRGCGDIAGARRSMQRSRRAESLMLLGDVSVRYTGMKKVFLIGWHKGHFDGRLFEPMLHVSRGS
jgi:hypothetical protein